MKRRLLLHLLFWLVYFSINLFNELYLSSSFNANPSFHHVVNSFLSQLLILGVKIPAVYYILYSFIPDWQHSERRWKQAVEALLVLSVLMVIYRLLVHMVIWPTIWKEGPGTLTKLQLTARVFYSTLDVLQVTGIAAAIKLFRMRMEAIKREQALVQEKLRAELLHLKAQVNPHFLFNALNNIYALARNKSGQTPDMIMRLSKILRYMLYETANKKTTIGDELKIIDDYLELQQLRFGDRKVVQMEKSIDNIDAALPPLIIVPLIENAYKHGNGEASTIFCKVQLKEGLLDVQIVNPVVSEAGSEDNEGIGLANINRQLELMYTDYHFNYKEKNQLFVADLHINLHSYAGDELFNNRR